MESKRTLTEERKKCVFISKNEIMRKNYFKYSFTGIFLVWYIVIMEKILSAIAEPNRLNIIGLLRDTPCTVGEIAEQLQLRQPQVSKHLRVLSEVGLVVAEPVANKRIYKLRPQPLMKLDTWLEPYRQIWEERFDQLDDYLVKLQEKEDEE